MWPRNMRPPAHAAAHAQPHADHRPYGTRGHTAFTCNDFDSCVVELNEAFTLRFSFTDTNGGASSWHLTAERADGAVFDMDQGAISPPSGSGTITRVSPGFSCPSGNCPNSPCRSMW